MVFIGGPRQVGKTTLAKKLLSTTNGRYFNWDYDQDRYNILQHNWSNKVGNEHSILVTGSARLDVYRRGGDSLLGRYHYWRLHPFTLDEIKKELVSLINFYIFQTLLG